MQAPAQAQRPLPPSRNSVWSPTTVDYTIERPDQTKLLHASARIVAEMIEVSPPTSRDEDDDDDPFICHANSHAPTTDAVYAFLREAYELSGWSPEVNIIALVLLNRFCDTGLPISAQNWNKLLLIALLIAQKLFDDVPLTNTDFPRLWARLFPEDGEGFTTKQLNGMEHQFLNMIGWNTYVSRAVYCTFYFELRALFFEAALEAIALPGDVLTDEQAQWLEMRTSTRVSTTLLGAREELRRTTVSVGEVLRWSDEPGESGDKQARQEAYSRCRKLSEAAAEGHRTAKGGGEEKD